MDIKWLASVHMIHVLPFFDVHSDVYTNPGVDPAHFLLSAGLVRDGDAAITNGSFLRTC